MTLNSSVVVQGKAVKMRPCVCASERVDEAMSGGKLLRAGKVADCLLSCQFKLDLADLCVCYPPHDFQDDVYSVYAQLSV